MRVSKQFSILAVGGLFVLACSAPRATSAAGEPAKPTAASKPDTQQKVWTNDDVERLNPDYAAIAASRANGTKAAAVVVVPELAVQPALKAAAVSTPGDPQKDPAWYGPQVLDLQEQLAAVETHEAELLTFRATATGLPTGLTLNGPTGGITTDNLIANLEAQRQDILAQLDALADLARVNGLPPGVLVEGRGLTLPRTPELSGGEQRAALAQTVRDASEELAGVRATVSSIQDQAASLGATLQPPTPGFGGNMTTDLLERLNAQAAASQSVIDGATDAARSIGVAPGDLR